MIPIEEFIPQALSLIVEGIKKAQDQLEDEDVYVNPFVYNRVRGGGGDDLHGFMDQGEPVTNVEFDLALTFSEDKGLKGGFKLGLGSLGVGVDADSKTANAAENRIRFKVPVAFPLHDSTIPESRRRNKGNTP